MSWAAFRRMLHDGELGRLRRWAATFIEFSLVQGAVQLVGVATGIVVVRLLSTEDYGLYTIANSVLGALVVLADSGIGTATAGIGGAASPSAAPPPPARHHPPPPLGAPPPHHRAPGARAPTLAASPRR